MLPISALNAIVPVVARRVPSGAATSTPPMGLITSAPSYMEMETEKERALAVLMTFKRFNPPTFRLESHGSMDRGTIDRFRGNPI